MVRPPYQVAIRLCAIAAERWPEIAAAYYQIRLAAESPHQFLNLVYSWCIKRVPHDKYDEWIADLYDLLPWQNVNSEAAAEIEGASFMAMASKGGR